MRKTIVRALITAVTAVALGMLLAMMTHSWASTNAQAASPPGSSEFSDSSESKPIP